MQILLSNSQAGPGRTFKQEQEEISRNHVQAFIPGSVLDFNGPKRCLCLTKYLLKRTVIRIGFFHVLNPDNNRRRCEKNRELSARRDDHDPEQGAKDERGDFLNGGGGGRHGGARRSFLPTLIAKRDQERRHSFIGHKKTHRCCFLRFGAKVSFAPTSCDIK